MVDADRTRPRPRPRPRDVAEVLAVVALGDDRFRSAYETSQGHVFGGLLLAQAMRAATETVDDDRPVHAVHGSFLSSGAPGDHLDHHVERTRDGSSFATRRVTTSQGGRATFTLTAEFQRPEEGASYEIGSSDVAGPHGLAAGRYDNGLIASRDVPAGESSGPPHVRHAWFRVRSPLGDEPALHAQALVYLSDFGATRAVREPHAHLGDDARRMSVSLTHSVWIHRPVELTGWVLSSLWPVATGGGRGLTIGSLRTEDGDLLATVAQEALLRSR